MTGRGSATREDDTPPRHLVPVTAQHIPDDAPGARLDVLGDIAVRHDATGRNRLDHIEDAPGQRRD
jgi:hypothetical protein